MRQAPIPWCFLLTTRSQSRQFPVTLTSVPCRDLLGQEFFRFVAAVVHLATMAFRSLVRATLGFVLHYRVVELAAHQAPDAYTVTVARHL